MANLTATIVKIMPLFVIRPKTTFMNSDGNAIPDDKRRESINITVGRPTEIEIYNVFPSYKEDLSKIIENHTLIYKK